jgi:hypothetical protein
MDVVKSSGGGGKSEGTMRVSYGGGGSGGGYSTSGGAEKSTGGSSETPAFHPDTTFETLKDGSTALIIRPGYRLKLKLSELLEGGDAQRDKNEKRKKKQAEEADADDNVWFRRDSTRFKDTDGDGEWSYSRWFKEYVNEYTITIDMKLTDEIPREGISLFQTSLVHTKEVGSWTHACYNCIFICLGRSRM